ncbi:tubulin-folding cofactor B [Halyomorpha halys]|uniref:tubulin-folding cofactor B n=1 Tax=Halyomorpha halys TaxID=286706 RepID=UPI0006D4F5B9|nr:tubulin-folding cofactor B [Halyomorpha halys]
MADIIIKTSDYVNVLVSASCQNVAIEKRFKKDITVLELKEKLELVTGGSSNTMKLKVFTKDDKLVCALDDNNALIGSYHIDDGMRLHVEDSFSLRKQLEEDESVEKYKLSEEEYAKREDSVLAYLKRNKLGKFSKDEQERRELQKKEEEEAEAKKLETLSVGARCEVSVPGQPTRRAAIRFIGTTHFKPGTWVGVQYDEPMGKNDGSVDGKRYFECPPKYGGFVKLLHVTAGDFPEEELNLDDEL